MLKARLIREFSELKLVEAQFNIAIEKMAKDLAMNVEKECQQVAELTLRDATEKNHQKDLAVILKDAKEVMINLVAILEDDGGVLRREYTGCATQENTVRPAESAASDGKGEQSPCSGRTPR